MTLAGRDRPGRFQVLAWLVVEATALVRRSLERRGGTIAAVVGGVNLIRLDSSLGCAFLPAAATPLALPAAAGFRTLLIEARTPSPWSGDPRRWT